jgi:predicted acetyltransferase
MRSLAEQVSVKPAPLSLESALRTLLTAYLDELAELEGVSPRPRDDAGHATYRWFDDYWTDPARTPLVIWSADNVAGFCLLRETDRCWQIAEFYVAPRYRRQRIGAAAVEQIVARCWADRKHPLIEANTLPSNAPALAFWRRQGFRTVLATAEHTLNVLYLD